MAGTMNPQVTIGEIVENVEGIFSGNLIYYYQVVLKHARNLRNDYHNFRHMFHVMWACYQGCLYHQDELSPGQIRNILIAAIFHDFNHSGRTGDDDLEIERALRRLRMYIHDSDRASLSGIEGMIRATQFPYQVMDVELPLGALILRDADMSQTFSVAWFQQVILGLGEEMGMGHEQMLAMQPGFIRSVKFLTAWGKETFSQAVVEKKAKEAEKLLELLNAPIS